jgi:hypothetical protein
VVDAERLAGIVVCERRATRPFDASDLETGLHAVDELAEALIDAGLALSIPREGAATGTTGHEPALGGTAESPATR